MGLGVVRGAWKFRQSRKNRPKKEKSVDRDDRLLEPKGSVEMEFPVTVNVSIAELDQYGFTANEQKLRNPRIVKILGKVI